MYLIRNTVLLCCLSLKLEFCSLLNATQVFMSSNFCSIQEPLRMLLQWLDANIEAELTQGYTGLIWIIFLAVIPHMSLSMNCSKKHRDSYCWKLGNFKCFVITESWTSFNACLLWLISLFCSSWTESFNLKKKSSFEFEKSYFKNFISSFFLRIASYMLVSTLDTHFQYGQSLSRRHKH